MKNMRARIFSVFSIILLLFGILPSSFALASTTTTQYFQFTTITPQPTNTSSLYPVQVNQSTWDVSATFLSQVIGNSITYSVQQVIQDPTTKAITNIGQPVSGGGPDLTGGAQSVTFHSVHLFSGLNQITVTGTLNDGTTGSSIGYIYNTSVPVINSITVGSQATDTNTTLVVTSPTIAFNINAPNTTSIQVYQAGNSVPYTGTQTYSNSFIASGIQLNPGENDFTFVASNGNRSYQVTRKVAYFTGQTSVYNATANFGSTSTNVTPYSLQNSPVLSVDTSSQAFQTFAGSILLPKSVYNPSNATNPTYLAGIMDASGNLICSTNLSIGQSTDYGQFASYSVSAAFSPAQSLQAGDYYLNVYVGSANSSSIVQQFKFTIHNSNGVYFQNVSQLNGVTGDILTGVNAYGSTPTTPVNPSASYSSIQIGHSMQVVQLPFYIEAAFTKPAGVTLDLSKFSIPELTSDSYKLYIMTDGNIGIRFEKMPSGSYPITLVYDDSSKGYHDTWSINVSSQVAPNIQVYNAYDQERFSTQTATISGQMVNFQQSDYTSLTATLNGTPVAIYNNGNTTNHGPDSNGNFQIDVSFLPNANHLVIQATSSSGGTTIPVQLSYTLFYFSSNQPTIQVSSVQATTITGQPASISALPTNPNAYNTTGNNVSITGSAMYASTVTASVNGQPISNTSGFTVANLTTGTGKSFSLTNYILQNGTTTFSFTAYDDYGNQTSITISVTKTQQLFTVVTPSNFPVSGAYITNSNFIDLVLETSTADSIVVNKVNAVLQMTNQQYGLSDYGVEISGLKPGLNTLAVQITKGSTKLSGTLLVNYVNQNLVGAQYKTQVNSSGKLAAFNNLIQLQFPKNTVFQPKNPNPGRQQSQQTLYANQQMLIGIADRITGNINKASGSSVFPSAPFQQADASNIPLDLGENYASSLMWIDAGDPTQTQSPTSYIPAGGLDPGTPGVENYMNRMLYTSDWLEPTSSGTLTLQYDPSIRNASTINLSVLHLDHASKQWVKLGGVVNTSSHTITVPFTDFGYYVVVSVNNIYQDLSTYTDVTSNLWAKTYLETMYAKGIMAPKTSTSFGVYDNISRGEFVQILIKALGIPLNYDSNNSFDDVPYTNYQAPGQLWSYAYIETGVRAGIVHGIANRAFAPNDPISRQDAAVMIARAANYTMALDPTAAISALQKAFTDAGSIDGYAAPAVLAIYNNKIINGKPNQTTGKKATYYFDPYANLSRAEAAAIATHLMQQLKLLPSKL